MLLTGLFFLLPALAWSLPTPPVQPLAPAAQHARHGAGYLAHVGGHKALDKEHGKPMRIEAVDKVKQLMRTRAMEWQYRMQHIEDLLEAYKVRHQACVDAKSLPGPYITFVMPDDGAGIGNQLPGVVSGQICSHAWLSCLRLFRHTPSWLPALWWAT